jgi:hypothetical protein
MPAVAVVSHDSNLGMAYNKITNVCRPMPPRLTDAAGTVERDVCSIFLQPGVAMESVVQLIFGAKRPTETMAKLVLYSHGNNGMVLLGGQEPEYLGKALAERNANAFAVLRPHFHPLQRVIKIFACGVASDTSIVDAKGNPVQGTFKGDGKGIGYLMIKKLASVTDCPVEANINQELNIPTWKGPSVLVYPDGGLVQL